MLCVALRDDRTASGGANFASSPGSHAQLARWTATAAACVVARDMLKDPHDLRGNPPVTTQIQDALLSAEAFPEGAATHVERVQTHISWVFLLERDVYKLKRPVELGFLDFRTVEKRR